MRWIYSFLQWFFIVGSTLKNAYRGRTAKEYRGMTQRRFQVPSLPNKTKPRIWIHGVSVGEISSSIAIVDQAKKEDLDVDFVFSATTGTGYHQALRMYQDQYQVFAFPFDLSGLVRKFLQSIQPDVVVLMEQDIWPNFLIECHKNSIPVIIANGRLSQRSAERYQKIQKWLEEPLKGLQYFLAQDQVDAQHASMLGLNSNKIKVTGNLKFDQALEQNKKERKNLVQTEGPVWIAASTHEPEEKTLTRYWLNSGVSSSFILVPRHPERAQKIKNDLNEMGVHVKLYTNWDASSRLAPGEILLVDQIGVLSHLYPLADWVFIGGSLIPHGGQNMIEPAACAKALVYGPYVFNFREATALLEKHGTALRLKDESELAYVFNEWSVDREALKTLGEKNLKALDLSKGAAGKTCEVIREVLEHKPLIKSYS